MNGLGANIYTKLFERLAVQAIHIAVQATINACNGSLSSETIGLNTQSSRLTDQNIYSVIREKETVRALVSVVREDQDVYSAELLDLPN